MRTLDSAKRCCFLTVAVILSFAPILLCAQTSEKEAPSIELSATMLGEAKAPPLFYVEAVRDGNGKIQNIFKPLSISVGTRSAPIKLPLLKPMQLFTGGFDENGEPQMKPFASLPDAKDGGRLLLVLYLDQNGKPKQAFLDDSAGAHPVGTVRFANFSDQRVSFSVGGKPTTVSPGDQFSIAPSINSEARFPFVYSIEQSGKKTYTSPTKLLRFRQPESRLLILYTNFPFAIPNDSDEEPEAVEIDYQPMAYRLYDTI